MFPFQDFEGWGRFLFLGDVKLWTLEESLLPKLPGIPSLLNPRPKKTSKTRLKRQLLAVKGL